MTKVDLSSSAQTEYFDRTFKSLAPPDGAVYDKSFDNCTFIDCALRETVFVDCRFSECLFSGSDLSLVQVKNCAFTSTQFEGSQLVGINWAEANWHQRGFLKTIDFTNCVLNYSSFFGLELKEMKLVNCIAKEVDFAEANITGAQCRGTDFLNSRFQNTNLTQANFTGAINYAIAAQANVLKATKFSLPEAMSLLYSLDIILSE